jgi:uncharacterized protein YgiM (DUF1202 family)
MNARKSKLLSVACAATLAMAAASAQIEEPPRWVKTDDLRVRAGPGHDFKAVGRLYKGSEVVLESDQEHDGYCLVEGEGQFGYVACRYLDAAPVARPRAGEGGVDPATRWVDAGAVNLREAARADSSIVARLPLNSTVRIVREDDGSGYCEVRPASGPRGYAACRYLATAPLVLAELQDSDPERAFWIHPGWDALIRYVDLLRARDPDADAPGPWPRDEALEQMKATLARGLNGPVPEPLADWQDLERKAEQAAHETTAQPPGTRSEPSLRLRYVAGELEGAIGIAGPLYDVVSGADGTARVIGLVRALEFPSVQPSLFHSESELAPPDADAEELSGRFGIVYRTLVSPRRPRGDDDPSRAGLYDMLARTTVLVRRVQRVVVFRDGRIESEPSLARQT